MGWSECRRAEFQAASLTIVAATGGGHLKTRIDAMGWEVANNGAK
jgi:hypothetical protein